MLSVQVCLTAAVPMVTHKQRIQFRQAAIACMSAQGITYCIEPRENRLWFRRLEGSRQGYVCLPTMTFNQQGTLC
jgi:hypothetical protein